MVEGIKKEARLNCSLFQIFSSTENVNFIE